MAFTRDFKGDQELNRQHRLTISTEGWEGTCFHPGPMSCFPHTCHLPCLCPIMQYRSYFWVQNILSVEPQVGNNYLSISISIHIYPMFKSPKAPVNLHHGTLSMAANGPLAFRNSSTVPFSIIVPWMGVSIRFPKGWQQGSYTCFQDCFKEPPLNTTTWSKFRIVSWDHQNAQYVSEAQATKSTCHNRFRS